MEENNKSFLTSFRRAFKSTSNRREKSDGKAHVSKRKELVAVRTRTAGLIFPEDDKRYEDVGDFTGTLQHEFPRRKAPRKIVHTLSESRKDRPVPPPLRSPLRSPMRPATISKYGANSSSSSKSATLPNGTHAAHTIRIPPPRHRRKFQPLPSPDHIAPLAFASGFPPPRSSLPHTMSSIDCSSATSPTTLQQRKTAVNISRTGPTTLPHDYSEPFHWLTGAEDPYSTVKAPREHKSSWSDKDGREPSSRYASLQVSASMVDLRANGDYMEINRSTLNRPTVASDYQQPIALRRLPGPPTAVKQRQQQREEKKLLRGTIVVLDENKTLEV